MTSALYFDAILMFDRWAVRFSLPSMAQASLLSTRALNSLLVACLQQWNLDSLSPQSGADLLAGIAEYYPHLRGHLTAAWRAHRTWRLATPSCTRVPLDFIVWRAMLATCATWDWYTMGVLLSIGFRGYLRLG